MVAAPFDCPQVAFFVTVAVALKSLRSPISTVTIVGQFGTVAVVAETV